jgi:hypothetical protein
VKLLKLLLILFVELSVVSYSGSSSNASDKPSLPKKVVKHEVPASLDALAEQINKESLIFFKSLIGLSRRQVVRKFPARTVSYPLGWTHSKDCTLFKSSEINAGSTIELRYENERVTMVRESSWSCEGERYGKWVR